VVVVVVALIFGKLTALFIDSVEFMGCKLYELETFLSLLNKEDFEDEVEVAVEMDVDSIEEGCFNDEETVDDVAFGVDVDVDVDVDDIVVDWAILFVVNNVLN
jgi:hypothetical protein